MHVLIDHPCVQHKLALIRDVTTGHKKFRELATEITEFVCYEALKNVNTREVEIETPIQVAKCRMIDHDIVVVPVLRAGVGMLEGISERFYAITVERELVHPGVVAISNAARHKLFGAA